jgi:menaquinone-specific isochorismate synthase
VLTTIRSTGEIAPLVVGALPFDGEAPATLVVPRSALVRRADGRGWRVVTHPEGADEPSLTGSDVPLQPSMGLNLTPIPSPAAYVEAVATARKRIADGELDKVVLARMLMARADQPFDRRLILRRLEGREPGAYLFGVHGFVGASPELLIARASERVLSKPVAGTIARPGDPEGDARAARVLLASSKERAEHALVVDAVRAGLQSVCDSVRVDPAPSVLGLHTVLHLTTEVHATLNPPRATALELAARLHPTPAVCGTPRGGAMRLIRELEAIDRTLYAGLVGWTDARGDGEWAVALRCAEVQGRIALLFAGAGIVADSDPEAELAETEAKFLSLLHTLEHASKT